MVAIEPQMAIPPPGTFLKSQREINKPILSNTLGARDVPAGETLAVEANSGDRHLPNFPQGQIAQSELPNPITPPAPPPEPVPTPQPPPPSPLEALQKTGCCGFILCIMARLFWSLTTSPILQGPEGNIAVAPPLSQPIKVTLSLPAKIKEWYLEVKELANGEVITAIEIIYPKNKAAGEGRKSYETKGKKILTSLTNFIEIDLLRRGKKMVAEDNIKERYHILVSRSSDRPQAYRSAWGVGDPIPEIPLPLAGGELEPTIDLQELLNSVYELGSYDLLIDYEKEPIIPLSKGDRAWADELLKQQGLR